MAQKLSATAARMKAVRDLRAALTPRRSALKADSQKKRRKAKKNGKDLAGLDYDHKDGEFKTVEANRGNDGEGTKNEGTA